MNRKRADVRYMKLRQQAMQAVEHGLPDTKNKHYYLFIFIFCHD